MKKLFISSLSKAINAYLHLDPESKERLQKLKGKAITIELLPFHFVFQCIFSETGVHIQEENILQTETKIHGTPMQMLNVMIVKEDRQRFFAEDLTITGNAELGQHVVELFDEMQIDWEELFAHFVGDIPAHHTGRVIHTVREWISHSQQSFKQNINEYVHEEAQWFPSKEALNDFFTDIDILRMDVDRMEVRIEQLLSTMRDAHENN